MKKKWLFIVFVAIPGFIALISLGVWQTKRLTWKEALLANIDQNLSAKPIQLPQGLNKKQHNYRMVQIEGTFDRDALFVLTSTKEFGPGFRVVSPFNLEDGSKVLVDRGVIREDEKNELKTSIQNRLVIGYLFWPNETDYFTPEPNFRRNIWFARDLTKMSDFLSTLAVLVVATEDKLETKLKMQNPSINISNNHLQYAITWFMMSILWFGMSVYFVYKIDKKEET
tara:strand:+ start:37 stop:714 length:678 start_codon:yes stop_codon:yes gene_type:complete